MDCVCLCSGFEVRALSKGREVLKEMQGFCTRDTEIME